VCASEHSDRRNTATRGRHAFRTIGGSRHHDDASEGLMEQHGSKRDGGIAERAGALGAEAHEQLDELRHRASELNERIIELIKERPGTALLLAAGVGFFIGRILRS
jgi:hypothetical protein